MKEIALQIPDGQGNPIQIHGVGNMPEGGTIKLANIVAVGFDLLILTAVLLCLIWFIWGAINWMMSEGDKQKVNQAREKLVYSIIGLGVVLLSFLMINAFYWFFLGTTHPLIYPK